MTPEGLDRLKLDEGLRLTAYPDPKSGDKPWGIGYGCTGPDIVKGLVWTKQQADGAILLRVSSIETRLTSRLPVFSQLSPIRKDVLINIAYNIGVTGLLRWYITLGALAQKDYKSAATDVRNNKIWRVEVDDRVDRCADALENNSW